MKEIMFDTADHEIQTSSSPHAAPIDLHEGRLFALSNPIELDGRVAWFPDSVRGYAPVNAYLLVEEAQALMIDTGVTVHRDALIKQLLACLSGKNLSLAFTRLGEYPAICNATAIAEALPVEAVYGMFTGVLSWLEFRPRAERGGRPWAIGHAPKERVAMRDEGVPVGIGGRRLHVMPTPIRLLPSQWFYDDGTRTLFTGDAFSHAWRLSPEGPWLTDAATRGIDLAGVRDHLLARCWWMDGAHGLQDVKRNLAAVFETYDVEVIAPGYGCIIHGRDEVELHYEMMQDVISELAKRTTQ